MKLSIGETIRTLRREKDLTQEDFAEMFGVTYQSVSRWEHDSCYPDVELLPDIAAFSVNMKLQSGMRACAIGRNP